MTSIKTKASTETETTPRTLDLEAGRRAFLRTAGLFTAGIAALGGGLATRPASAQALTDTDILNFALNLEYLEAEFYLRAAFNRGLSNADVGGSGTPGVVVGGARVPFQSATVRSYAEEIAGDEEAHVKFLRSALGGAAVARPRIDLRASFTAAARAAGLIGAGERFDAFANETNFLLAAFIFEDVGVTAYKGAARFISDPDVLEAAAGILAVEAYHAGEIRTLLYGRGLFKETRRISDARDALDGAGDLDQPIRRGGDANIIPADANGLAFSRTPSQVLQIVYLGGAPNNFGFFPQMLNGTIK